MKLERLEWQNFNSYGNKIESLEFPETGQLIGLFGKNGDGKCLSKDSIIFVEIENEEIKQKFLDFLKKKTILSY